MATANCIVICKNYKRNILKAANIVAFPIGPEATLIMEEQSPEEVLHWFS